MVAWTTSGPGGFRDSYRELQTVREVIRRLEQEGWVMVRQTGSHRQFRHPTRAGLVTVAGGLGAYIARGTLNNVARQAGWKP